MSDMREMEKKLVEEMSKEELDRCNNALKHFLDYHGQDTTLAIFTAANVLHHFMYNLHPAELQEALGWDYVACISLRRALERAMSLTVQRSYTAVLARKMEKIAFEGLKDEI